MPTPDYKLVGLLWAYSYRLARYDIESLGRTIAETLCTSKISQPRIVRSKKRRSLTAICFLGEDERVPFEFRFSGWRTVEITSIRLPGGRVPLCGLTCPDSLVESSARMLRIAGLCAWNCVKSMTLMIRREEEWYLLTKHTGRVSQVFQGRVVNVDVDGRTGTVRLRDGCTLKISFKTRRHVRYGSITSRVVKLVYECPFTGRAVRLV